MWLVYFLKQIASSKSDNKSQIFEQYKLFVESAEKVSEKRSNTNKFYVGIITFIFGFVTIILQNSDKITPEIQKISLFIIFILGFLISLFWLENIKAYKQTNSAKYKVINRMERRLPFQPFEEEWQILKKGNYRTLSNIESTIPLVFSFAFLLLAIFTLNCNFTP
jgi:hypothetical protein